MKNALFYIQQLVHFWTVMKYSTNNKTSPKSDMARFVHNIKHLLSKQEHNLNIVNIVSYMQIMIEWNEMGRITLQSRHKLD